MPTTLSLFLSALLMLLMRKVGSFSCGWAHGKSAYKIEKLRSSRNCCSSQLLNGRRQQQRPRESTTFPSTTRRTMCQTMLSTEQQQQSSDSKILYWNKETIDDPSFINVIVPRLETIRMIVFDKDGTLGDDKASLRRWAQEMSNYIRLEWEKQQQHHSPSPTNLPDILQDFYQRIGWDDETQSVIPSAPLAAGTWQDQVVRVTQLLREYQVVESDAAAAKKAQEWQDALSLLHACDPPLIPGLPNLLTHLSKDYSWKVAICTSDDRGSTNAALQHWNVADVIQYSICGDEVTESKPSAQPLHRLCQQANVLPCQCLVVGDTTSDTGMATNANAGLCFGVLTGSGSAEQLSQSGAHVILSSVADLPHLLHAANTVR